VKQNYQVISKLLINSFNQFQLINY